MLQLLSAETLRRLRIGLAVICAVALVGSVGGLGLLLRILLRCAVAAAIAAAVAGAVTVPTVRILLVIEGRILVEKLAVAKASTTVRTQACAGDAVVLLGRSTIARCSTVACTSRIVLCGLRVGLLTTIGLLAAVRLLLSRVLAVLIGGVRLAVLLLRIVGVLLSGAHVSAKEQGCKANVFVHFLNYYFTGISKLFSLRFARGG